MRSQEATAPVAAAPTTDELGENRNARQTGWLARLVRACWRHRWVAVGTMVASMLGVGSEAISPLVTRIAVDQAVHGAVAELPRLITLLSVLAVLRFGAAFIRRFLSGRLSLDVQHDLRRAVFAAVRRLDGRQQDALHTGQVVARALTDLQQVQGLLSTGPLAFGYIVLIVVSLAAMLWLSPPLTIVAVVVLPVSALLTAHTRRTLFPATWSAQQSAADIAQHVEETVTGVRVVKGFGQEAREIASLERRALRLYRERLRTARLTSRLAPSLDAVPVLGLIAVFGAGGVLALHGQISIGTFLAFSTYVSNLVLPARVVGSLVVTGQLARAGVERVHELIDARPEITDPPYPVELPDGPLSIQLDGVRFGHTRDNPVLEDVSFDVAAGETVALVGAAGSGKSSIVALLSRFYDPQDGEVRVGGIPLTQLRLRSLRRELGVVFDETILFSDTIKANIAYGRPDATETEIREAACAAQVDTFVDALPAGYDTLVGDRGLTVSGGQRQRIALARALLCRPRILLLDDATSALDTATEAAVHAALRETAGTRTTLLVARRRSTLTLADRIVVLDRGRIVAIGTEAELDARGVLRSIFEGDGWERRRPIPGPEKLWPVLPSTSATQPGERQPTASDDALTADRPILAGVDPTSPDPGFTPAGLLRPVRRLVVLTLALIVGDALTTVTYPALARLAVDGGIEARAPAVLAAATGMGLLVAVAGWVISAVQIVVSARAGESVLYLLRVRTFAHLQRLGLDFYERESGGRIMTRMTTDVSALSTFLQTGFAQSVACVLTVFGIAVALVFTDPGLALVALAPLPVLVVATVLVRPRVSRVYSEARELVSQVNADLQENVSGLRVVQAFLREEHNERTFIARSLAYRASRLRAQRYIAIYFPFVEMMCEVALVAVLAVGADRVALGGLTPGLLTAFLLYLDLFFAPLQVLSQVFDGYQQARVGLARIGALLRTPASMAEPMTEGVEMPPRLRGLVELREVGFRYPGGPDVLRAVSLQIRPGETIALVGATGAGKSTLVKLLARFYDVTSGQILVDGVDVRRYPLAGFRRRLGVVPQEPHLFTGDVASNIAYGRPNATPEQIEAAARAVGALEMIGGLPDGFRQQVGEQGQSLSAGQRQLVALARAELVDPDFVLLDEATAALDPAAEAAVLHATERLSGPAATTDGPAARTTVLVAHRLATAARADRIVVIEDGRVVEQGTHVELMSRIGRYAHLWRLGQTPGAGHALLSTTTTSAGAAVRGRQA